MKKLLLLLAVVAGCTPLWGQNAIMQTPDGKYGVTDASGKWIVPAQYQFITQESNPDIYQCVEQFSSNHSCFYTLQGKKLTPASFMGQRGYDTNEINKEWADGKLRYLAVSRYDENDNSVVYANIFDTETQKALVPWKYVLVENYNGFIKACPNVGSKYFDYYDRNGNLILAEVDGFVYVHTVNNGNTYLSFSKDNKLKGVYDPAQRSVIFTPREVALVVVTNDDNMFEVQLQHEPFRRTYYDKKTGKELVPMKKYESADHLGDGLFRVRRNGKVGLYNKGKEIVECAFDRISAFEGGVAQFEKNGEVRLIKNPLLGNSGPEIKQLIADAANKRKADGPAVSRYPAAESDVDLNVPSAGKTNDKLFAFIIANENYPDAPVPYALNDGRAFRKYCESTLGVPEKNVTMLEDATFGSIVGAVEKLKNVADAYDGEASVLVYYAGHGFPDEKQNSAYLLPIDGNASDITTTGFSLAEFYKVLGAIKLKQAVVFLDACFSGAKREDEMLASSRGVSIKVKEERPATGNMVVFSASQGDETAHQMEENRHGLFTYYLLKGIQEQGADTNLGELTDYVTKQVRRQSVVINDKRQTPTVIPSMASGSDWREHKLAR